MREGGSFLVEDGIKVRLSWVEGTSWGGKGGFPGGQRGHPGGIVGAWRAYYVYGGPVAEGLLWRAYYVYLFVPRGLSTSIPLKKAVAPGEGSY